MQYKIPFVGTYFTTYPRQKIDQNLKYSPEFSVTMFTKYKFIKKNRNFFPT